MCALLDWTVCSPLTLRDGPHPLLLRTASRHPCGPCRQKRDMGVTRQAPTRCRPCTSKPFWPMKTDGSITPRYQPPGHRTGVFSESGPRPGRLGGSTLTMQTARILDMQNQGNGPTLPNFATHGCQAAQMFRALQLEYHFTKAEILGLYLTHAPFGANIEGIQAACYTWLGKAATEMTRSEAGAYGRTAPGPVQIPARPPS